MFKIRKTAALAALFCSSALNAWASVDHMVIAMPQIPTIIEPQGINNNAIDRYVGNVFETLLKADQKTGELKPGLAESWCRLSPDTVEFKLRSGVRVHDGTPLTADDVDALSSAVNSTPFGTCALTLLPPMEPSLIS